VYATGDVDRPIYIIPTHAASEHNTVAIARTEPVPTLNGLNRDLTPEMSLIYRFIFKGDGAFMEAADYRMSSPLPAGGVAATSADSVSFTPTGDIAATNVQAAIVELDTEKEPVLDANQKVAIHISEDEPVSWADGELWFQIPEGE